MRVRGFGSSVLFGAIAAIGIVFAQHLFAPLLGSETVLALYLAGALVAYSALLGKTPREVIRKVAVASLGALGVLSLTSGIEGVAIGLSAVLAGVRSGLDSSLWTPRRFCGEVLVGLASLTFASAMASPGWLGSSAGIWGFALVQSVYFLLPVAARRSRRHGAGDPFERARAELLNLLGES